MFPPDRYEAAWTLPRPEGRDVRRVIGRLPIGHPQSIPAAVLWVDSDSRLATDWPGFPGTLGALVKVESRGEPTLVATSDPALAALADPIPLRRTTLERLNARCMVDYGLAPPDVADFVDCDRHGHGAPALACRCVPTSDAPLDVVVLYGLEGDYPDLLCEPCLARYTQGALDAVVTVCSRCQQQHLYRHRIVARTWYGAAPVEVTPAEPDDEAAPEGHTCGPGCH